MTWLPRTLGVLTAGYGVATLVRPSLLTGPTGLSSGAGSPSAPVGILVRAVGVRDVANGIAMATAPTGSALRLAVVARIAADLGDAVAFGLSPNDDASAKKKTVAVAAAWGALNLLGLLAARRA